MGLVQTALVSLAMLSPDHAERARRCAELLNEHLQEHFPEPVDVVLIRHQGKWWVLADITLRMLKPAELYRAQGFPCGYQFEQIGPGIAVRQRRAGGREPTDDSAHRAGRSAQVRMVGNSVSPLMAHALVRANFAHEELEDLITSRSGDVLRPKAKADAAMPDMAKVWRDEARRAASDVARLAALREPATVARMEQERGLA